MWKKFLCIAVAGLLVASCQQGPGGRQSGITKQGVGTVAGAGLGAVLGSNIGKGKGNVAAIALGTLLGAGLGSEVGASLDRADMAYYNQTSQRALENQPNGAALPWSNPQTGNSGHITPLNFYQNSYGQHCREYTQTIMVGGQRHEGYGTACRQPDGSWQIQG